MVRGIGRRVYASTLHAAIQLENGSPSSRIMLWNCHEILRMYGYAVANGHSITDVVRNEFRTALAEGRDEQAHAMYAVNIMRQCLIGGLSRIDSPTSTIPVVLDSSFHRRVRDISDHSGEEDDDEDPEEDDDESLTDIENDLERQRQSAAHDFSMNVVHRLISSKFGCTTSISSSSVLNGSSKAYLREGFQERLDQLEGKAISDVRFNLQRALLQGNVGSCFEYATMAGLDDPEALTYLMLTLSLSNQYDLGVATACLNAYPRGIEVDLAVAGIIYSSCVLGRGTPIEFTDWLRDSSLEHKQVFIRTTAEFISALDTTLDEWQAREIVRRTEMLFLAAHMMDQFDGFCNQVVKCSDPSPIPTASPAVTPSNREAEISTATKNTTNEVSWLSSWWRMSKVKESKQ